MFKSCGKKGSNNFLDHESFVALGILKFIAINMCIKLGKYLLDVLHQEFAQLASNFYAKDFFAARCVLHCIRFWNKSLQFWQSKLENCLVWLEGGHGLQNQTLTKIELCNFSGIHNSLSRLQFLRVFFMNKPTKKMQRKFKYIKDVPGFAWITEWLWRRSHL